MYITLLTILTLFTLGLAWRKAWIRLDMAAGAVFAIPFLVIPPLIQGSVTTSLSGNTLLHALPNLLWVMVLGALASALYALHLHHRFRPVSYAHRALMMWLVFIPVLVVVAQVATGQSFLFCALLGIVAALAFMVILQRTLLWDTLVAMVGMGVLYVFIYFFLGHSFQGLATSGILLAGYPAEDIFSAFTFGALLGPPFAAIRSLYRGESPFHSSEHRHVSRRVVVVSSLLVIMVLLGWIGVRFVKVPQVVAASPANNGTIESLISPITIQLDRPLDRTNVSLTVTPPITGDISFDDPYVQRTFMRKIIFTPETYFQPDTTYTVQVSALKNIIGRQETSYSYSFHTPSLPTVTATLPAADQNNVIICDPLSVTLNQPVTDLAEIGFQLTPAVELESTLNSDKASFTLKPKECLSQATPYNLSVVRRLKVLNSDGAVISTEEPVEISNTSFTTKGAPGILAVTPQGGGVAASTKEAVVTFSEPMAESDLGSFFTVTPAVAGSWSWRDPQTAVYAFSEALPFDTHITLDLKEGLKDQKGGFLAAASFSFTTIGHVHVSRVSPYAGSGGIKTGTPIKVSFDQVVDHASAESRFSLSPAATGSFSWDGSTMVYTATLSPDTGYTVTVAEGVHSLEGLDLAATFKSTFQTEESSMVLAIPVYYQLHQLSCEIASLKMALSFKGEGVSEDQLLSQIPTDSSARNGDTWADPDSVFVGNVNGKQNSTGYGVHAEPIQALASNYRTARSATGWSMQQIAQSIVDSNPVVIWGTLGTAKKDSWTTPGGRSVSTWVGEHARLLIGFTGSVTNPTGFIINDPIQGRIRWTTAQFKANWGAMGSMAVAVL